MRPPAFAPKAGAPESLARARYPYAPGPKGGEWRGAASVRTWAGLRMPKRRVERRGEAIWMESSEIKVRRNYIIQFLQGSFSLAVFFRMRLEINAHRRPPLGQVGRFIERGVRLPWLQVRHARPPLALLRHPPVLNSDQTAK